jgi:hypothetical protein
MARVARIGIGIRTKQAAEKPLVLRRFMGKQDLSIVRLPLRLKPMPLVGNCNGSKMMKIDQVGYVKL